jgi:endonuclease YncB( thermonuclease family)
MSFRSKLPAIAFKYLPTCFANLLLLMLAKLIALLVLCSVLTGAGQERLSPTSYVRGPEQAPVRGRIVAVTDGDTIKVLTASQQQIRVRIAFIDAPEKGQAFGQRAKQAMSELVFGKDVRD